MEHQAPYSVRLDPEQALHLAKHGTSLLLLDAPASLSFGIDLQMFVVGPNFKGIKMLPPGPHFVYYCASSKEGNDSALVTGFFIYGTQSQVIVRRWDPQQEVFTKLVDSAEEERFANGVRNFEFDRYLAPYDLHHLKRWQELTKYITPGIIERLQPIGGDISVIAEAELVEQHPQTAAERRMVEQIMNSREAYAKQSAENDNRREKHTGRCFYTRLPRLFKRSGADVQDLTSHNLDKSVILEAALKQHYEDNEEFLLGELQFAYVAFLMGQSLESFSQWKAIIILMLSCQQAPLRTHTLLFIKFLDVLYNEMRQGLKAGESAIASVPDDFSWFTEDNFLRLLFKDFLLMLKNTQPIDGELLSQARRLQKLLETCLDWDLENEDSYMTGNNDEYAPVVVMEE